MINDTHSLWFEIAAPFVLDVGVLVRDELGLIGLKDVRTASGGLFMVKGSKEKLQDAQKKIRRLSRGKPRFKVVTSGEIVKAESEAQFNDFARRCFRVGE